MASKEMTQPFFMAGMFPDVSVTATSGGYQVLSY